MSNSVDTHLLAPQYYQGLKDLGVNVFGTYYYDTWQRMISNSQFDRAVSRIYPSLLYKRLNVELWNDVEDCRPDIVWIFKGMEIYPETLRRIKQMGIKLVNYNLDHPFRYISRASGNSNVLHSIELYDLHFSYSRQIIREMQEKYPGISTCYLPFGYHAEVEHMDLDDEEVMKVCFIGNGDKARAMILQMLEDRKIEVDVYGPQWEKYFKSSGSYVKIHPPVYGHSYWQTMRKYRIQLNLLRTHNANSHNMRTFETPAVGGIMLAPFTQEQADFFNPDEEAFFFNTHEEMLEQIEKILAYKKEDAMAIRSKAKERSYSSGYSYFDRSKTVSDVFTQNFHG